MNNDKHSPEQWQEDLNNFLADSSPSLDNKVVARTYEQDDLQAIEQALHIEQHLDEIGLQAVPESLQNKLSQITKLKNSNIESVDKKSNKVIKVNFNKKLSIVALAACVTMVSILNFNWSTPTINNQQPSLAEINQAQQDLAIAFQYLSLAKTKSTTQLTQTINLKVHQPMMKSLLKPLTIFKES
jgi:hypothetical protein